MATIDIQVPDIGDFDAVGVIEVLVKPGDTIAVEQSLITVESDKASMEIPSSHAGVVKELKVKLGDQVKQGSVVLTLEVSEGAAPAATATVSGAASAQPATVSASNQPEISAQTAQAAPVSASLFPPPHEYPARPAGRIVRTARHSAYAWRFRCPFPTPLRHTEGCLPWIPC